MDEGGPFAIAKGKANSVDFGLSLRGCESKSESQVPQRGWQARTAKPRSNGFAQGTPDNHPHVLVKRSMGSNHSRSRMIGPSKPVCVLF